jgi:hypothetical protein
MLELYALPQLPPPTILQQNGAPHFCYHVRNHLDREMAGRWISRSGPVAWPPRSPDLSPLYFFSWGYVNNIVYQTELLGFWTLSIIQNPSNSVCCTPSSEPYRINIVYQVKINDLQNLKTYIREAVPLVTPNMLQVTWNEVKYCLDICHATKGAHIKIY